MAEALSRDVVSLRHPLDLFLRKENVKLFIFKSRTLFPDTGLTYVLSLKWDGLEVHVFHPLSVAQSSPEDRLVEM